jgi:hypothetical protein
MHMEREFPAHSLMKVENQIQAKDIFIDFKKKKNQQFFFSIKFFFMKSLKHKDIHTNFKLIYLITFLHKACAKI